MNNSGKDKILLRYQSDVALYQKEIEDIKDQLLHEDDPHRSRQLGRMLLETQSVLTDVLMRMEEYK